MSIMSKILNTTLGGALKAGSKKAFTTTRGRGILMAAAGYYGGNYALDKVRQDLSAEYGSQTYDARYSTGEGLARNLLTGAAITNLAVGGIFGKSMVSLAAKTPGKIAKSAKSIFSRKKATSESKIPITEHTRNSVKTKPYASIKNRKSFIFAGMVAGLGYGYNSSLRKPVALEGRNVEIYGQSAVSKMNFDTAGLVQSIHNNRRRLM